jgi:hypothetical protein
MKDNASGESAAINVRPPDVTETRGLKEPDVLDTPEFHDKLHEYYHARTWLQRAAAMQNIKAYVRTHYKAV